MRETVEFQSSGDLVEAHLYTPDGAEGPFPVVVMAGGWCYVKELIQPEYARRFVDAGFAALVFDYRRLGGSGGEPRQHLDPWDQQEDYKNAISYVETLDEIDAERIAVWGISYSGGHVLGVGATDPRVKCIVSNIPVVDGWYTMKMAHGSLRFRELMDLIVEDRRKRCKTGEYGYLSFSGDPGEELVTWPFPEIRPVFEQLKAESAPAHEHRNTIASVEHLLNYTVFPYLPRILNTPTLMIVADHDDITMWDREIDAYNAISTAKKKLFIVGDTTHMTLYSNLSRLEIAAVQAKDWLTEHLITPFA